MCQLVYGEKRWQLHGVSKEEFLRMKGSTPDNTNLIFDIDDGDSTQRVTIIELEL